MFRVVIREYSRDGGQKLCPLTMTGIVNLKTIRVRDEVGIDGGFLRWGSSREAHIAGRKPETKFISKVGIFYPPPFLYILQARERV